MLIINRLSLADAKMIIEGALIKARDINVPMCVAVTDESGNLIAFERQDGTKITSVALAQDKAFTAAGIKRGTDLLGEASQPGGPAYGINTGHQGRMMVVGGGLPVIVNGDVVGAVGLSAGSATQDAECARAGIDYFLKKSGLSA